MYQAKQYCIITLYSLKKKCYNTIIIRGVAIYNDIVEIGRKIATCKDWIIFNH